MDCEVRAQKRGREREKERKNQKSGKEEKKKFMQCLKNEVSKEFISETVLVKFHSSDK